MGGQGPPSVLSVGPAGRDVFLKRKLGERFPQSPRFHCFGSRGLSNPLPIWDKYPTITPSTTKHINLLPRLRLGVC